MRVFCYSGGAADERPVAFELDGTRHGVVEVISQWRTPEEDVFRVRASDGKVYILRHARTPDEWTVQSVRS